MGYIYTSISVSLYHPLLYSYAYVPTGLPVRIEVDSNTPERSQTTEGLPFVRSSFLHTLVKNLCINIAHSFCISYSKKKKKKLKSNSN